MISRMRLDRAVGVRWGMEDLLSFSWFTANMRVVILWSEFEEIGVGKWWWLFLFLCGWEGECSRQDAGSTIPRSQWAIGESRKWTPLEDNGSKDHKEFVKKEKAVGAVGSAEEKGGRFLNCSAWTKRARQDVVLLILKNWTMMIASLWVWAAKLLTLHSFLSLYQLSNSSQFSHVSQFSHFSHFLFLTSLTSLISQSLYFIFAFYLNFFLHISPQFLALLPPRFSQQTSPSPRPLNDV